MMPSHAVPGIGRYPEGTGIPDQATAQAVLDTVRQAVVLHRSAVESNDPERVRLPGAAADELFAGLARNVSAGLACNVPHQIWQVVPFPTHRPAIQPFSQHLYRSLARQGCQVHRLYLVASGMDDDQLDKQIREDEENLVTVESLPIDRRLTQTTVPMTDMWLIDDRVVVNQELSSDGSATWLVSTRPHEVAQGRGHWYTLLELSRAEKHAPPGLSQDGPPDLTAYLLRSAPLIRSVAAVMCVDDPTDIGRCDWYHGVWQYLRLFNMVSSPNWHADFYYTKLRDAIRRQDSRRILVSGAADYSMLAFVLAAADPTVLAAADPTGYDIHVLDRCPTPLAASQWYARELKAEVKLHQADITTADVTRELMPEQSAPYDLIVADAFLTRFDRETSGTVLQNWSRLLKPGGVVVTTVRLHPRNVGPTDDDDSVSVVRGSHGVTDAIADFHFRLRERAEGWRPILGIDLDQLCRAARDYALRMTSNDLGGHADIRSAFHDHDFDIVEDDSEKVDGELVRTEYLRVVARKRA